METKWARNAMRRLSWILMSMLALPAFATEKKITVQGVIRRTGSTGTDALVNNASASITLTLNHCSAGYSGDPASCPGYSLSNSSLDAADTTAVIKNGAFSVSLTPKSSVVTDMAKYQSDDWYVIINGQLDPFASGGTSEFPIRIESVPFAAVASTALNALSATALNGISVNTTGITDGQVLKWDQTSNTFLPTDMSAGGMSGVSGVATYAAGTGIKILGGATIAVDTAQIATLTTAGKLTTAEIPTITGSMIGATSITSTNLASNSINTAHIADDQVTDAKIDTVSGSKITGTLSGVTSVTTATLAISGLAASKLVFTNASKYLTSATSNVTDAQLAYLVGVTAPIQTQINTLTAGGSSLPIAGGTMTGTLQAPTVNVSGLTASKILFTDASKNLSSATSAVTDTQLGYLAGVTSNTLVYMNGVTSGVQTQINALSSGSGFAAGSLPFSALKTTSGSDETTTSSPDNSDRVTASRTYGAGSYSSGGSDKTFNVLTRISPAIVHTDCGVVDTATAGSDNVICAGF